MRYGQLSKDNLSFLHGKPTSVPGSWTNGSCACKNKSCLKLKGTAEIQSKECAECQRERKERNRVLVNLDDERVRDAKFVNAPAIFPNNDIKYEVAKKRAGIFAASKNEAITWAPAKDCPSSAVLSEKPNIVEEKSG